MEEGEAYKHKDTYDEDISFAFPILIPSEYNHRNIHKYYLCPGWRQRGSLASRRRMRPSRRYGDRRWSLRSRHQRQAQAAEVAREPQRHHQGRAGRKKETEQRCTDMVRYVRFFTTFVCVPMKSLGSRGRPESKYW